MKDSPFYTKSKYPYLYQSNKLDISYLTFIFTFLLIIIFPSVALAGPQSTSYEIKTYEFGSGGTQETNSTNYSLQGQTGAQDAGQTTSTTYGLGSGLTFTNQIAVPPSPTFTNPAGNYDRLKFVLQTGNNPSDTTYAIAISADSFVTTLYVQNDNTVGTVLGSEDWQSYTTWGGASGAFVRTLTANTTYQIKVKAKNGKYTETAYGPTASTATTNPSLTFGISLSTLTFNNLNSGNSYTDNTKTTVLTTSTNAYNGYIIYGRENRPLTAGSNTIADYVSPNSAPTTWSSTGFGYTTDDNSLSGGTADRFTNGGPKYSGFGTSTPGDPVADHTTAIQDPTVTSEQFTITYKVAASATTPAGSYTNNIIYVVVPTY